MSLFYELYTTPRWRKACRKTCRNLPAHGWSPSTEGAVIVCIFVAEVEERRHFGSRPVSAMADRP
jgi:hypothetical protein